MYMPLLTRGITWYHCKLDTKQFCRKVLQCADLPFRAVIHPLPVQEPNPEICDFQHSTREQGAFTFSTFSSAGQALQKFLGGTIPKLKTPSQSASSQQQASASSGVSGTKKSKGKKKKK